MLRSLGSSSEGAAKTDQTGWMPTLYWPKSFIGTGAIVFAYNQYSSVKNNRQSSEPRAAS